MYKFIFKLGRKILKILLAKTRKKSSRINYSSYQMACPINRRKGHTTTKTEL